MAQTEGKARVLWPACNLPDHFFGGANLLLDLSMVMWNGQEGGTQIGLQVLQH